MAEQMPDVETIKSFNTGLVEEFRANGGKVGGKYKGANLLLLTTSGAKTGQPRIYPAGVLPVRRQADHHRIVLGRPIPPGMGARGDHCGFWHPLS